MPRDDRDAYLMVFSAALRCVVAARDFGVRFPGPEDPAASAYVTRAVRKHLGDVFDGIGPETARRAIADAMRGGTSQG